MKRAIIVASVLVVVLFALFVWPTRYRYERIRYGWGERHNYDLPVRINRITGNAGILYPTGQWEMYRAPEPARPVDLDALFDAVDREPTVKRSGS